MQDRFFQAALAAAQISPEAFAEEFKKAGANPNVREYFDPTEPYGKPLLHAIIREVHGETLPAILNILVEQKADLEICNDLEVPALSLAASYGDLAAVRCLIELKANVNHKAAPVLCSAVVSEDSSGALVKYLVEHKADVNLPNQFSATPLMSATTRSSIINMQYLLTQNADIFLAHEYGINQEYKKTALGIAYENYMFSKRHQGENHAMTKKSKKCFELLLSKIQNILFVAGKDVKYSELYVDAALSTLAGEFISIKSRSINSHELKNYLNKNIKPSIMNRINDAKGFRYFVNLGMFQSQLNKPDPVGEYFKKDGQLDTVGEIGSYFQVSIRKG